MTMLMLKSLDVIFKSVIKRHYVASAIKKLVTPILPDTLKISMLIRMIFKNFYNFQKNQKKDPFSFLSFENGVIWH